MEHLAVARYGQKRLQHLGVLDLNFDPSTAQRGDGRTVEEHWSLLELIKSDYLRRNYG